MARTKKTKVTFNVKPGDKVRVIGNQAGAGLVGRIVTVFNVTSNMYKDISVTTETGGTYTLYGGDYEPFAMTLEEIEKSIIELEKEYNDEISTLKLKRDYLTETGSEAFDDTEYKVYSTLKLLKQDMSDLEKAKIIATLVNN